MWLVLGLQGGSLLGFQGISVRVTRKFSARITGRIVTVTGMVSVRVT